MRSMASEYAWTIVNKSKEIVHLNSSFMSFSISGLWILRGLLWGISSMKEKKKKPINARYACENMTLLVVFKSTQMMSIVFCVTVHPSPLPRRHTLPSGCSCKVCNQESKLCCRERLPSIHRLGEKNMREEGRWLIYFFFFDNLWLCTGRKRGKLNISPCTFETNPRLFLRSEQMPCRHERNLESQSYLLVPQFS